MQQNDAEYKRLLSEVIKKQIVILGPDITLAKARNVPGLEVADDGSIISLTGSPQEITQKLVDQFVQLSGLIVKKTMEPLLFAGTPQTQTVATPTVPIMPETQPVTVPTPQTPTYPLTSNAPQVPEAQASPVAQTPVAPDKTSVQ